MSEEQLAEWESELYEKPVDPEKVVALIAEVRKLRAELDKERKYADDNCMIGVFHGTSMANDKIRQLDKEADWLAEKCAMLDDGLSGTDARGYREIAREVVKQWKCTDERTG